MPMLEMLGLVFVSSLDTLLVHYTNKHKFIEKFKVPPANVDMKGELLSEKNWLKKYLRIEQMMMTQWKLTMLKLLEARMMDYLAKYGKIMSTKVINEVMPKKTG